MSVEHGESANPLSDTNEIGIQADNYTTMFYVAYTCSLLSLVPELLQMIYAVAGTPVRHARRRGAGTLSVPCMMRPQKAQIKIDQMGVCSKPWL